MDNMEEDSRFEPNTSQARFPTMVVEREKTKPIHGNDTQKVADEVTRKKPSVSKFVDAINQILVAKKPESGGSSMPSIDDTAVKDISSANLPSFSWNFDELDVMKDQSKIEHSPDVRSDGAEVNDSITYDDPVARSEKRKLLEQLQTGRNVKKHKEENPEVETLMDDTGTNGENDKKDYKRVFLTTGVPPEKKKRIADNILFPFTFVALNYAHSFI
ncbi:hypothetical protein HDU67_001513 [Dinochytrium kinnereticum]|nr:hypothetical protein HDU67_001513 [Dinochytrium kinnereticum]